jgi:hypothetical protein
MKLGARPFLRRSLLLAVVGVLIALVSACTGRGGGQLPPDNVLFTGSASFGFSFSCENGDLRIQLSYNDQGSNPLGSSFGIHGIVDQVDPVLESALCIDSNPPPVPHELTFLGRYYLTSSSAPAGFPDADTCPRSESDPDPLCRFEVHVIDNDYDNAPSAGDFFSIRLSTGVCLDPTDLSCSVLSGPVFYTRSGLLSSGNLTVD